MNNYYQNQQQAINSLFCCCEKNKCKINELQNEVSSLECKVKFLQSEINTNTNDINQIKAQIIAINNQITILNNEVAALQADVLVIEGQIAVLQADVLALQGDVTTLQADVLTLQGEVTTIQTDITTINGEITTIQTDITTLQTDVLALQGDVTTLQTDVSTLQSDVTTINSEIATINDSYGMNTYMFTTSGNLNNPNFLLDTFGFIQNNVAGVNIADLRSGTVLMTTTLAGNNFAEFPLASPLYNKTLMLNLSLQVTDAGVGGVRAIFAALRDLGSTLVCENAASDITGVRTFTFNLITPWIGAGLTALDLSLLINVATTLDLPYTLSGIITVLD